ncbi:MAG: mucoidy inhibitor MuiA family protein [Lutibacter sp.]
MKLCIKQIKQNTKVDWKNVKLSLSTANPNKSGVAPVLKTYYLNYNVVPPQYNLQTNTITGIVSDKQGPLPGVNVIVKGTTIGTSTDFDGKYSITIPNNANQLAFSYLGYETEFRNINNSIINVNMKESNAVLEEVVVTGYGKKKKNKSLLKALSGKVSGVSIRGASSTNLQLEQIEKQTSVNFDIKIPYTINSDNKKFSINMANYNIAADYTYYSVPKINQNAYLMAKITNWEKYNLLEGEANIFFENTFIGKSILDVRYGKDSLKISLGIDKNVYLKRENNVKYESKKFIGSRKEELRNWKITIKNNKKEPIKMVVYDQIPISTNDEIKVELLNSSSGKYNVENGEIEWKLLLKPFESKELLLKYFVKYPKNKNLIVE